jgi:short-subunit dehydrogenase
MLAQGFGAVYNMEGMGSDGRTHDGLSLYGTSKYALKYLTDALVLETKETPLMVGALRPGMVVTELVTDQYSNQPEELARVKGIFNIIADTVDNVGPWLADRIMENQKTGVRIRYTSIWKLLGRFLIYPFKKRDLFADVNQK